MADAWVASWLVVGKTCKYTVYIQLLHRVLTLFQVMPWDPDADFQITEADMFYLAAYHNMTTYHHRPDALGEDRDYLLEINPHFAHRDMDDWLNIIDARWIDMETGLFADITAARYALNHRKGEGVLYDKNGHEFRVSRGIAKPRRLADKMQDTYLYPLQQTTFEKTPALIPYRYKEMLQSEYGDTALTSTTYNGSVSIDSAALR